MIRHAKHHNAPRERSHAQAIQRLQAIDARHVQIEQDQIRIMLFGQCDTLFAVAGFSDHLQAGVHADELFYAIAQHRVVINQ
ncbi:hypothetical protein D3C73_839700 [compost metagenome]